ncbi:putative transposon-derived protein F52C9.6, partial [Aphis craccivora]
MQNIIHPRRRRRFTKHIASTNCIDRFRDARDVSQQFTYTSQHLTFKIPMKYVVLHIIILVYLLSIDHISETAVWVIFRVNHDGWNESPTFKSIVRTETTTAILVIQLYYYFNADRRGYTSHGFIKNSTYDTIQKKRRSIKPESGKYEIRKGGNFKYLGVNINNSNNMHKEIKERISNGNRCCFSINKLLRSKLLSRKSKTTLYTSYLRP